LRNFLLIEKIRQHWRINSRLISKHPGFTSTPPYFRRVLQKLSQNIMLQNMIHSPIHLTRVKKKKKSNSRHIKK